MDRQNLSQLLGLSMSLLEHLLLLVRVRLLPGVLILKRFLPLSCFASHLQVQQPPRELRELVQGLLGEGHRNAPAHKLFRLELVRLRSHL
jgi:hypothetical protein